MQKKERLHYGDYYVDFDASIGVLGLRYTQTCKWGIFFIGGSKNYKEALNSFLVSDSCVELIS